MLNLVDYILEKRIVTFLEKRIVTFDNKKHGQCVILAGGPGSGKGFIAKNNIIGTGTFKTFNVDGLKEQYIKLIDNGTIKDKYYDLSNPKDTEELHYIIKDKNWNNKKRNYLFNNISNKDNLPNILFDITAKKIDDIREIIEYVIPLGYEITLVWVLCNIDSALEGNNLRDRKVPERIVRDIHSKVNTLIPDLLTGKYNEIEFISNAWVAYSAGRGRELSKEFDKNIVDKLKKLPNGSFNYNEYKEKIDKFLSYQQPLVPKKEN